MARSKERDVLTDIQTLLNKQEENIKHHIDEVRDELRLFKSAIDKLFTELQQVKQRQESLEQNTERLKDHVDRSLQVFDDKLDKLEGFSRRDNLKFFGITETGEDSCETCAATIINLLQETIPGKVWQTTDIVRAHRVDEEEDNTILRADKHGEQIDTNEVTRRGSIINNLQMIPTEPSYPAEVSFKPITGVQVPAPIK
ncbi:hypothetical protein C0Q70_07382 [Pomacea canaliculata]|uniref:Uncharacterized protein n=1 Tax=Pomacea canaliculata TaxID=400727 RepID=A0A2T7PEW3_POMCA|nr:hypothetical protein C0Q70_07382 [Pomacea canaliculata]